MFRYLRIYGNGNKKYLQIDDKRIYFKDEKMMKDFIKRYKKKIKIPKFRIGRRRRTVNKMMNRFGFGNSFPIYPYPPPPQPVPQSE